MKLSLLTIVALGLLNSPANALPASRMNINAVEGIATVINTLEAASGSTLSAEQKNAVARLTQELEAQETSAMMIQASDDQSQTVHLICVDINASAGVTPIHGGTLYCTSLSGRIYKASFFGVGLSLNVGVGVVVGALWTHQLDSQDEHYECNGVTVGGAVGFYGARLLHGDCYRDEFLLGGWEGGLAGGISVPSRQAPLAGSISIERVR